MSSWTLVTEYSRSLSYGTSIFYVPVEITDTVPSPLLVT